MDALLVYMHVCRRIIIITRRREHNCSITERNYAYLLQIKWYNKNFQAKCSYRKKQI